MKTEHLYRVEAWWVSGKTGIAKAASAPSAIHFTAPPDFGGVEERWTPEDLLLAALAGCFTTTFQAVAANSKFEYIDLAVEAQGVVGRTNDGYGFSEMILRPTLTIPKEEQRERAVILLDKTKALCLVSRAISTTQRIETRIEIGQRPAIRSARRLDAAKFGSRNAHNE